VEIQTAIEHSNALYIQFLRLILSNRTVTVYIEQMLLKCLKIIVKILEHKAGKPFEVCSNALKEFSVTISRLLHEFLTIMIIIAIIIIVF